MDITCRGRVIEWRGPAPFYWVTLSAAANKEIAALAPMLTYGWGVVPIEATIGTTTWVTSLMPKDAGYLLPLKVAVRRAEGIELDAMVSISLRSVVEHIDR